MRCSWRRFPILIIAVRVHFSSLTQFLIVSQFSDKYNTAIPADDQGFAESWTATEPFELPKIIPRYKTEADLHNSEKVLLPLPSSQPRD